MKNGSKKSSWIYKYYKNRSLTLLALNSVTSAAELCTYVSSSHASYKLCCRHSFFLSPLHPCQHKISGQETVFMIQEFGRRRRCRRIAVCEVRALWKSYHTIQSHWRSGDWRSNLKTTKVDLCRLCLLCILLHGKRQIKYKKIKIQNPLIGGRGCRLPEFGGEGGGQIHKLKLPILNIVAIVSSRSAQNQAAQQLNHTQLYCQTPNPVEKHPNFS